MPIMSLYDFDDDFDEFDYIEEYGDIQHECKDCKYYKIGNKDCSTCVRTNTRAWFVPKEDR